MAYRSLRPSQVALDPENPRLPDGTSSDRDAINRLIWEGPEALVNLARDIAKIGKMNPSELPIAIKEGRGYVVLEGNRRFAALRLLRDPKLADDEEIQKAFRRAAQLGTPPKSIYTAIAANREEAEYWIFLRHTGDNNGVGVRRWSTQQTATHRRRANKSIDSGTSRSITIANELEKAYSDDVELINLIGLIRQGKLTNIGRLFSPDVMVTLGLSIRVNKDGDVEERLLLAHNTAEQLRDFFFWAFDYMARESVDAFKNADVREKLIESVAHLLPDSTQRQELASRLANQPFPIVVSDPDEEDESAADDEEDAAAEGEDSAAAGNDSPEQDSSEPDPDDDTEYRGDGNPDGNGQPGQHQDRGRGQKPDRYLFQGLALPRHNSRIRQLLKECKSIDIDNHPGVSCIMARVLVELSVSSPAALNRSGAQEKDPLRVKITSMLRFIDPNIEGSKRNKELEQAYLETSELGITYLNGFVHSPLVLPDKHLARRFSSAFKPFLRYVDEAL